MVHVHKTRSGKKIIVAEGNGKGLSSSGNGKTDLRKSSRETPPRACKSKLPEKQPPPTPHTLTKFERPEKLNTPSPLKTPDRGRRHILLCSSSDLNLSGTKVKGKKEKSVEQITMESEKVSTSSNLNVSMKRKRVDRRLFGSPFIPQVERDPMLVAIYEESKRSKEFHRFSSDTVLVGDEVNEAGKYHREVAEEFCEDHAAQADEVDSLSSSEGLNTGTLHSDGGAELCHANHIRSSTEEPIAALPEADSLKASINGCTISETLDESESLPEGYSCTETENVSDLIGSTPTSGEFNIQNGDHSIQRKADDSQTTSKLVSVTAQSTLAEHEKYCFTGSCDVCLKQKRLVHDSPKVDLCTCVAMPKKDFGNITSDKDGEGVEATVILGSAERYCLEQPKCANINSQVDNQENVCSVCKQGGKSLICYGKGCRRCYHLSCLGPPFDDVPFGVWHCLWCVKKKIKSGVHSVSKGIESVWDSREVELSGAKGTQMQKQYLVKYQGLAHVHNHWLPEAQLLVDVPSILADFNKKNPGVRWNSEWTKPQRLLRKRLLSFSKLHVGEQILDAGDKLECQYEWLVMWEGLGIENATWELQNADFLCSSNGLSLVKEYEICQGKKNEMFSQLTAYDKRLESSKFLEYWLPVQVSNLQLEQYCDTLLSNIIALCSYSKKNDPVGVLDVVLHTLRKCCDHPYILSASTIFTQPIHKGLSPVEILDSGINASGKLCLLDKMLSEMKSRHLRVVVLFQSIGSEVTLGNILEDFLQQRFGENSYARVETCLNTSKRQAALNSFNKKDSEQFVLLLENRICNSSIKLSSVDAVIIYHSDSNPRNDLRLLQKLSFVSQTKPIRLFRLYSCYTVEELALVIAKEDPNVDNLHSLNRNVKKSLMWGASYLFSRLDEYHASDSQASASDISYGQLLLNDVIKDFCAIISQNSEMYDMHNSVISKVLQSSGPCSTDLPLFGEQKVKYPFGEEPQVFWKILEGKNPRWRHISGPTPRTRKRVQYFESSTHTPEVGNGEAGKKRRKTMNSDANAIATLPVPEAGQLAASKEGASTIRVRNKSLPTSTACQNGVHTRDNASNYSCSLTHEVNVEHSERVALPDEQKSLHIYLKAELTKVFEVLKFSDDVICMVGKLLDFILGNHRVSREPETLLQALQISLCRMAASLLKQKVDLNEMLMLTKDHLKFECTEDEATNVYLKLRSFKKMFLHHLERNEITSNFSGHSVSALVSVTGGPQSKGAVDVNPDSPKATKFTEQNVVAEQITAVKDKVVESEIEKMRKQVQCQCDMRMSRLEEKQQEEIEKFHRNCEEEKVAIERNYNVQLAIARTVHGKTALATNSLKILYNQFARQIEEHNRCNDLKMKEIEDKHKKERDEEKQKAASWLAQAKDVTKHHSCTSDSRDDVGYLQNIADADNNISDSRAGDRDLQDNADSNNNNNKNMSDSREDIGNLQDIAGVNRNISDPRDDVGSLLDSADVNNYPMNVASRNDIGNLEDNADVNNNGNINNPKNVASGDDIGNILDVGEVNNPPSVASVSGCDVEANEPSNISNESEHCEVPSNLPKSTDEVQSKDDLATTVSDKPMGTISSAEALVASLNQPNEVGNIGNSCEEDSVPVVPVISGNHTLDEISSDEHADGLSIEVRESANSEDVINDHPSEVNEIALNGVVRHEHPAEASITAEGFMAKTCTPTKNTKFLNNDGNQNDVVNQSAAGNSASQEQLLVVVPSVQTGACSDDGVLLQNQDHVSRDQCSQLLTSNELQFNQGSECEAGSPRGEDARPVALSNCESILTGNSEPQESPSGGFSIGSDRLHPGEAACESPNNESNDLHCSRESRPSPQLVEVEKTAEPLCNAEPPGRVSSEPRVSVDVPNMTVDQSQTGVLVSRIDCQPSGELHCSPQNTQAMPNEVRITSELPNQAILQPSNVTSIHGPNNMRMYYPHFAPSLNSPIHLPFNPLSKELERISKEMDQAAKSHENWKVQQVTDCEKEIKEMIAKIRSKYEAKIQEGETAFLQRKSESERNQNRVLMNKILAEAFSSKCLDPRPTLFPQMKQAVPSSNMQHLQNASMPPSLRSVGFPSAGPRTPNPAGMRPPPSSGFSSAGHPTVVQQTPVPPLQGVVNHSTALPRGYHPPPISRSIPTVTTSSSGPSASCQVPPSSSQAITRAPALSPTFPGRPPVISDISPSSGNPRLAGDIRAPAPHLQPFRPTSVSPANPPLSAMPSCNVAANTPSFSPALPRVALQPQTSSPPLPRVAPLPQTSSPSLPRVAPQPQTSSSSLPVASQPPQLVSSRLSQIAVNSPLSANKPNTLPPLPEIGTTFGSIDLSDFGTTANILGASAAESIAVADVVCLSDDD